VNKVTAEKARDWFSGRQLSTIISVLTVSLLSAELLGVNRFLRTVIEGRAFWYYLLVFLVALALMLGFTIKKGAESQTQNLVKLLVLGAFLGFIASIIAVSVSPLLSTGSMSPTVNVWKAPLHLMAAAFLSLGWVYGILAELTLSFIQRRRYRHIGILIITCTVIRLLETLPIGRLIQR
jgi:hypothetical protein